MACRLFGTMALSKPVINSPQPQPDEQSAVLIDEIPFEVIVCNFIATVSPLCPGKMSSWGASIANKQGLQKRQGGVGELAHLMISLWYTKDKFKSIHSAPFLRQINTHKKAEVTKHAVTVMTQIDSSIKKLNDPAAFTAELKELGGRHTGYKVTRAHLAVRSEPTWNWHRIWPPY